MKISLGCRYALMVGDGASTHKIDHVKDYQSRRASKLHYWFKSCGNFAKGGTLPIGGVATGRVCACSLRSWPVLYCTDKFYMMRVPRYV